jgi:tRNA uridine 5-carboxymethylaminomethyl modification enzyme
LYKAAIRYALENQENLSLFQQAVEDLIIEDDVVKGVKTQMGLSFTADKVILTSGTFLGGGESFKPLRIKSCVCSLVCVM